MRANTDTIRPQISIRSLLTVPDNADVMGH
jgi:hypothetical protein